MIQLSHWHVTKPARPRLEIPPPKTKPSIRRRQSSPYDLFVSTLRPLPRDQVSMEAAPGGTGMVWTCTNRSCSGRRYRKTTRSSTPRPGWSFSRLGQKQRWSCRKIQPLFGGLFLRDFLHFCEGKDEIRIVHAWRLYIVNVYTGGVWMVDLLLNSKELAWRLLTEDLVLVDHLVRIKTKMI